MSTSSLLVPSNSSAPGASGDSGLTGPTGLVVPTLEFDRVQVAYTVRGIDRPVLREVSFSVAPGEAFGLVGESGCGKSTAAYAAMRYLPSNGSITGGAIRFEGQDITTMSTEDVRKLRADAISMVYQSPIASLNPSIRVGNQVAEVFTIAGLSKADAFAKAEEALIAVQIADVGKVMQRYPHELSGGMAQRVVIAMALATNPRLLILDEPTTGLDATVEAEVLDLIRTLRTRTNTSVLFISHNLGVIRSMCDRIGVLYAGQLVEEGYRAVAWRSPSPLFGWIASLHSPCRFAQRHRSTRHHSRCSASSWHGDARLCLCRSMPDCDQSMPNRETTDGRYGRRSVQSLFPS